jgi:leader peptidase (prepilin peptidase)/N-methyltransferase
MFIRLHLADVKKVSPHPAAIAAATAAVAVSLILVPGREGIMGAMLAASMVLIATIDFSHYTIPDVLSVPAFALGLAHAALNGDDAVAVTTAAAALRGVVAALAFWSLRVGYRRLRGRDGLGLGDIKLAAVAGAWLSWPVVPLAVDIAAFSALIVYGVRQYVLRRPWQTSARLPFGTFLGPAIWFGWIVEAFILGRM